MLMCKKRILTLFLILMLSVTSQAKTFDEKVDGIISGGKVATKSYSIGALYEYKYTNLLQKPPMCYCPWLAYVAVDKYVTIECRKSKYYLYINADLKSLLSAEAKFNKRFARSFKATGAKWRKVRKIYNYCVKTRYAHLKTAKDVFTKRQGDCAAISAAFYVLCKAKGIPVRYIIGWADGNCHAWNRVLVDGQWYWIDCTLGMYIQRKQFKGRTVMEYW